ncbi:MAG TPA: polysaccharide deacetylase family protein [Vicinamibacteria bacterium]
MTITRQGTFGVVALLAIASAGHSAVRQAAPVPDKVVVLTFDDSAKSHAAFVAPLLKKLGFGGTFFITEGFDFPTNKLGYMTWEEVAGLHELGFEIGNHTAKHANAAEQTREALRADLELIERRCAQHGLPRPVSFAYPGNGMGGVVIEVLKEKGYRFARRGGAPEFPYEGGRGVAFDPRSHERLSIPSAGDARPAWQLEDFVRAVSQAKDGKIAVLQFHGVPDREHPWVSTEPEQFEQYLGYLKENGYTVVALRDVAKYLE